MNCPDYVPCANVIPRAVHRSLATFATMLGDKLPDGAGEDSFNALPAWIGEPGVRVRESLVLDHEKSSRHTECVCCFGCARQKPQATSPTTTGCDGRPDKCNSSYTARSSWHTEYSSWHTEYSNWRTACNSWPLACSS
jgi:hypothetical protein